METAIEKGHGGHGVKRRTRRGKEKGKSYYTDIISFFSLFFSVLSSFLRVLRVLRIEVFRINNDTP